MCDRGGSMNLIAFHLVVLSLTIGVFSCQKGTSNLDMSATSKPNEVPIKESLDRDEVIIPNKEPVRSANPRPIKIENPINELKGKYLTTGLNQFRNIIQHDLNKKNHNNKSQELANTMIDSIESVEFRYDIINQSASLQLITNISSLSKRQSLNGRYNSNQMSLLNSDQSVKAKVICLDSQNNQCYEAYIELTFNKLHRARVGLIYRRRNGNYNITSITQRILHPGAESFASYLRNTSERVVQLPWLLTVVIDSFEVINGRSGVRLSLVGNDGMILSSHASLGFTQTQLASMRSQFNMSSDFSHISKDFKSSVIIDGSTLVDKMFLMKTDPLLDQLVVRFEFNPYRHISGVAFDIPFFMNKSSSIGTELFKSKL